MYIDSRKLRFIYLPFLIMAAGFIVLYTFLNWLLVIKASRDPREDIIQLWLPLILAWIPLLIWLRPRLQLLRLQTKKGSLIYVYLILAALAIVIPTVIAQKYLATASGKLTRLKFVEDINQKRLTKYYSIQKHCIDKQRKGVSYQFKTSGKRNQYLDMDIYISCPVFNSEVKLTSSQIVDDVKETPVKNGSGPLFVLDGIVIDSLQFSRVPTDSIASVTVLKGQAAEATYGKQAANGVIVMNTKGNAIKSFAGQDNDTTLFSKAWICIRYHKQISNRLESEEKERKVDEFERETFDDFDKKDLESFIYADRIGNSRHRDGYKAAIDKSVVIDHWDKPIILEPKFESFELRNGNKLPWIFGSFGIGAVVWLVMIQFLKFDEGRLNNFLSTGTDKLL